MARALDATVHIHVEPGRSPGAGGSWTADAAKSA